HPLRPGEHPATHRLCFHPYGGRLCPVPAQNRLFAAGSVGVQDRGAAGRPRPTAGQGRPVLVAPFPGTPGLRRTQPARVAWGLAFSTTRTGEVFKGLRESCRVGLVTIPATARGDAVSDAS